MNLIIKEFLSLFAREVAHEVAKLIKGGPKPAPGAEDIGKAAPEPVKAAEVFKPDITADRSESEWRADCLEIINLLAPTHGRKLRELLAKFGGAKRLSEVQAVDLPALLAELAGLKDAE